MKLLHKIVILGGGTAGWMTAAALSRYLPAGAPRIELIESDEIGTVGVGEATLPHLRQFNEMLGVDENEFMRITGATYKLAVRFTGWGAQDADYIHPFGYCGHDLSGVDFHHYWLRLYQAGLARPFQDYSVAVEMARQHKFDYPSSDFDAITSDYGYAFHVDATLYARFLRDFSVENGVQRTEGKVNNVRTSETSGEIVSLQLESGQVVEGDFFIDCSGFRGVLIEQALRTGYEDWRRWLPCDRALAVPTERQSNPPPYTRAAAQKVGWQWRIPLQHRTGNGYVYCSDYIDDEKAERVLAGNLEEPATADVRPLRFVTGKRKASWNRNVVAIGLSAGFLEPLESTSIYLIQAAIQKLLEYFPLEQQCEVERRLFNQQMDLEYERVRDFLILHYNATDRSDSDFWNYCRTMNVPDSLREKQEIFEETARVVTYRKGLFMPASWLAVYLGQGIIPKRYDPRVEVPALQDIDHYCRNLLGQLQKAAGQMQEHSRAIEKSRSTETVAYPKASFSLYGAKG